MCVVCDRSMVFFLLIPRKNVKLKAQSLAISVLAACQLYLVILDGGKLKAQQIKREKITTIQEQILD